MKIIDYEYYKSFSNNEIEENEFNLLYERSLILLNSITNKEIETVKEDKKLEIIKKAVANQIEYLFVNGGIDFVNDASDIKSVSLGRFSMTNGEKSIISPISLQLLLKTNLLYRGGNICI